MSTGFYCGRRDYKDLESFATSISLYTVPASLDRPVSEDPSDGPFCYLSPLPIDQLSSYGSPPVKLSDATDPLIGLLRSYRHGDHLVLGHIHWSNDVPDLAKITKPYYGKINRWIRKTWEKRGGFYFGPEACELVDSGTRLVNVRPQD